MRSGAADRTPSVRVVQSIRDRGAQTAYRQWHRGFGFAAHMAVVATDTDAAARDASFVVGSRSRVDRDVSRVASDRYGGHVDWSSIPVDVKGVESDRSKISSYRANVDSDRAKFSFAVFVATTTRPIP